ncbi:hypothetical protein DK419_18680 [Methylobacterium terrae]|uniref:Uncharacterized protein n=1 Tax=Methylobacterium terrae TaxID=2202827 RepID=A0A2U8WRH5_9HYPH|nr:hypothetical protein [Methylobacterium terrae]AWN48108.1 hypothetical protein DK419_18680 [Methylobacterium terrae]
MTAARRRTFSAGKPLAGKPLAGKPSPGKASSDPIGSKATTVGRRSIVRSRRAERWRGGTRGYFLG